MNPFRMIKRKREETIRTILPERGTSPAARRTLLYAVLALVLTIGGGGLLYWQFSGTGGGSGSESASSNISHYTCPMHPQIHEPHEGTCPICHMKLVPVYKDGVAPGGEEEGEKAPVGIRVSLDRQKMIGLTTTEAKKDKVQTMISTTGRVAFDPDLAVAVREYMTVLSSDPGLRKAAASRLQLLGMGEEEIRTLPRTWRSYESLYLPESGGGLWVYATLYEQEAALIKPGLQATISLPYDPEKKFKGAVRSLSPVVDATTRSITGRIYLPGAGGKLRPDTFVDIHIAVDLGEAITVPRSAIVDTGAKQVVFIAEGDTFTPRIVKSGTEAEERVTILEGLEEGESVVVSATFLIDSEARLKAVFPDLEKDDPGAMAPTPQGGHKHD